MGGQHTVRNSIQSYLESMYHHTPFHFDLSYDVSELTAKQKRKLRKLIKTEERSGARIVKKLSKNRSTKNKKKETPFLEKIDGNHREVAMKYNDTSLAVKPIDPSIEEFFYK